MFWPTATSLLQKERPERIAPSDEDGRIQTLLAAPPAGQTKGAQVSVARHLSL